MHAERVDGLEVGEAIGVKGDFRKWFHRNANETSETFNRGFSWGVFWMVVTSIVLSAIKHLAGL